MKYKTHKNKVHKQCLEYTTLNFIKQDIKMLKRLVDSELKIIGNPNNGKDMENYIEKKLTKDEIFQIEAGGGDFSYEYYEACKEGFRLQVIKQNLETGLHVQLGLPRLDYEKWFIEKFLKK